MPDVRYLDVNETDLAFEISRGLKPSEGFRILTPSEYHKKMLSYYPCCHPQG